MIGNKIADKTTKISKNWQQNNSETSTNEHHKEILTYIRIIYIYIYIYIYIFRRKKERQEN